VSELFDEVDEELRREQLKKIWEKYSLLIIGAAFLIVAGVGGWRGYEYLETQKAVKASAAFEAASTLADQNKHAEAEAAFSTLATDAPRGYRSMARLRAAAEAVSRDPKAAAKMYDDMAKRLDAATQAGGVYRHTARELLALAAWRAKNIAETRKWLDQIAEDSETPGSLRNRAEALQALLPPAAKS
jgi:hypothetical protein